MKKKTTYLLLTGTILYLLAFSSCYYDNLERLNPTSSCDTSGTITYAGAIKSIIDNNCTSCHSGGAPSGGISLDTYTSVKNAGLTGKLYNSVSWASGTSPMPKSAAKLDECLLQGLDNQPEIPHARLLGGV